LIGVLCTAGSAPLLRAQQTSARPDSAAIDAQARRILAQADSLRGVSPIDYRTVLNLLQRAEPLFSKAGSNVNLMVTFFKLAQVYGDLDLPDSSLTYLKRARVLTRAQGFGDGELAALRYLGEAFLALRQPDSAVVVFAQAIPLMRRLGDRSPERVIYLGIGLAYRRLGRTDSALVYDRAALAAPTDSTTREEEGQGFNDLGVLFAEIDQADSSLYYYGRALAIRQSMGDSLLEARTLQNIGLVYDKIGQPDSARAYYTRALPIERRVGDRQAEAATLLNIGGVLTHMGILDSSLAYGRLALPIYREIGDRAGEGRVFENIGAIYNRAGVPDSALAYFQRGIGVSRSVGDRASEAIGLDNIGLYFVSRGELDSAWASMHRALVISRAVGDRETELTTLAHMGRIFRLKGAPDSATAYFEQSAILAAAVSKQTGNDFNQLHYNEIIGDVYALWSRTWLDRARGGEGDRATYASLAASERGRAQALLRLMGASRELHPGADLPVEGQSLAQRTLAHAAGALVYADAGDTLITWLVLPGGIIHAVEQSVPVGTLDTLVAAIRYGVAQEDAIAERGGRITRGGSQMLDPLDQKLLTPSVMARAKAETGLALRRELTALLLPAGIMEFLPESGELLLIPQGGLGLIPFGLLPLGDHATLLGDRFALRYGPSLTAIADAEARPGLAAGGDRTKQLAPALIVGDPTMPAPFALDRERYAFDPLPGARVEGEAVADSVGAPAWLSGSQATEAAVRSAIPGARLIHLATHGLVYSSDAHSRLSFVALAPDATHDGHLSVAKIVDSLTFRAELVVLSACQTAVGNVTSAEGTLGLQRAVLAKGARSVLVSLWNVPDESTLFLIQRFYHHWLHDGNAPSKSEALRLAQADVRTEAGKTSAHRDWADPFYWSAFQLVGAP
jgi:tetratricopeptide (TPR) repeat protein